MTAPAGHPRPRIAVAGLGIESSVFSPARTRTPAFHPLRGDAVLDRYPFMRPGSELREAAQWLPIMVGKSLPGGVVTAESFAQMSQEIVDGLTALGDIDGLYYDIHGAMSVEGLDDAENVLLERIRAVIGDDAIVSTSMDLHGNVSRELAHASDLITCYRMAPHEDAWETKERAVRHLVELVRSGRERPLKAWVPVPVLLPGEKTSTRIEPASAVYAAVTQVEALEGVLDAAIWVGYAWADEPRNRAAVVVTGYDAEVVAAGAERLARGFWEAREDFAFVAPAADLDTALEEAFASREHPYFISDSGDNPTAGGAGDVTWTLARLLQRPELTDQHGPELIYASVPGPELVSAAREVGVGGTVTAKVGAAVDDRHEGPVTLTGTVTALRDGDLHAGTEVVVRAGSLSVIVTDRRKPYHRESDFTGLGLSPRDAQVVVVKIGYLEPELYEMARGWTLALTPGGVDQDLLRLGHSRIRRPMYPFDPGAPDPDLRARWIPAPGDPLTGPDE